MASTSFTDYTTVIASSWLNDVNAVVYTLLGGLTTTPAAGKLLRSNGTNMVATTSTLADTYVAGTVLAAGTTNTVAGTSTPTLGASGTAGSVTFGNATSGLLTLQPVTGALGTVTVSLPAATDTLVGKATTDTLSNKTLVAPALGTPASGVLTNCTGLPLTTGVSGVLPVANGGTGTASFGTTLTNSLSGDVNLNNTASFFTGPTVAQGTSGTWLCTGTITALDTAGSAQIVAKLWDGTTIIAMAVSSTPSVNFPTTVSVSGIITNPAGNIRIDVQDPTTTTGVLKATQSGSKNSTLTVVRIA